MSDNMEFCLVDPFDTDDINFALGVEWEMFRQRLKTELPFSDLYIDQNTNRLVAMAERHNRFVEHHPVCDGWVMINVGDLIDPEIDPIAQ